MSRLLVLLPDLPYPLDAGAKIRNHGLLRLLSEQHEVDAIAFGDPANAACLAKLTRRFAVVPVPEPRTPARRAADMILSGLPDLALRRFSIELTRTLRRFAEQRAYATVQAEGIEMAGYLAGVPPAQRVYDAHNAEFLLQRRFATSGTSALARLYSTLQWRRLERFEARVVQNSRLTLAVSRHDANQLLALASERANVRVVRNGIDAAAYRVVEPRADQSPNVLFLGKLDFRPNAEAVRWFVDRVLPPLAQAVPDARLFAVGASPPGWLIRAGQHDDRVAVTGYVPDERSYIARCAALVLPVHTGGGSRLKALIAMASGLPIVATRVGMEGLEAEPDVHYLPAETPAEWVRCLARLVREPKLRLRMARDARRLVEQQYDWSAIRSEVHRAYDWLAP